MLIRELRLGEKDQYNAVVNHPLQTWEWGEFRETTGVRVIRFAAFDGSKIVKGYTITLHPVPKTSFTIGYLPKSDLPDKPVLDALKKIGQDNKTIFIKIEPDIKKPFPIHDRPPAGGSDDSGSEEGSVPDFSEESQVLFKSGCVFGRPMFTRYNFLLDLTKSEDELLAAMKPKTRYNLKLAQKKEVMVSEDSSDAGFGEYLRLTAETTKRQKFYAHSPEYHTKMWKALQPTGIAHLFKAVYQQKVLVAWILFKYQDVLYYPYGASSAEYREVMASNLMMWEAIRFGRKMGCGVFDLWGSLGPDPDPKDPWYGFHRFKEGYGPQLYQTIGSFDLVVNLPAYQLYKLGDKIRWKWLKIKASLP